jgi:hypothetical protein
MSKGLFAAGFLCAGFELRQNVNRRDGGRLVEGPPVLHMRLTSSDIGALPRGERLDLNGRTRRRVAPAGVAGFGRAGNCPVLRTMAGDVARMRRAFATREFLCLKRSVREGLSA